MLKSMTGYGKASINLENKNIVVEIKSLNSKQLDVNTKIPSVYKSKELEIRNILKSLDRGKVELFLSVENLDSETSSKINKEKLKSYFVDIKAVADELGLDSSEISLQSVIKMPDVLSYQQDEFTDNEWIKLSKGIKTAVDSVDEFRVQEGKVLQEDITNRINIIANLLIDVEKYENRRVDKVRERISAKLETIASDSAFDKNRFEQEMIFYLEKLDVTEEKVRLKHHCEYFLKTVETDLPIGKKLGFISQEIGREINTLGSKANDSDIQKIVIKMKDELEKIKEQMLNVL